MPIKASEVKAGDTVVCDKPGMEAWGYAVGHEYEIEKVIDENVYIKNGYGKSENWWNAGLMYFSKTEQIQFNNYTE